MGDQGYRRGCPPTPAIPARQPPDPCNKLVGGQPPAPARQRPQRTVLAQAGAPHVHPESRWRPAPAWHSGSGGQDRPGCGGVCAGGGGGGGGGGGWGGGRGSVCGFCVGGLVLVFGGGPARYGALAA